MKALTLVAILAVLTACTAIVNSTVTSDGSTNNGSNDIDERKQTNLGRAPAKETSE